MQKRVVAVHDISCVGKCSLTVALPILSAAGFETSVLPTAVLSTHTGGFTGYTFRDLTEDVTPILNHWKSLNLRVDSVYTGYLGSFEQISLVSGLIDTFRNENTLVMVDPVMADNGKLYAAFDEAFPKGMLSLVKKADIVVPNLTEASLLLGIPYPGDNCDRKTVHAILKALTELGPDEAVLSGVSFAEGKLGAAAYSKKTGKFYEYQAERVDGYFHGTGDIFGSALLAARLKGKDLGASIRVAVNYTLSAIRRTVEEGTDRKYGVNFEESVPELLKMLR